MELRGQREAKLNTPGRAGFGGQVAGNVIFEMPAETLWRRQRRRPGAWAHAQLRAGYKQALSEPR